MISEVHVNKNTIRIYGTKAAILAAEEVVGELPLCGMEETDRLLLQNAIDSHKLKADILYNGNCVLPFSPIVKGYKKLQKTGSLTTLTKQMYHFFMYNCGDIAHYDQQGFIGYYDESFQRLYDETLTLARSPAYRTDVRRIFKEIGLGKEQYFDPAQYLNHVEERRTEFTVPAHVVSERLNAR